MGRALKFTVIDAGKVPLRWGDTKRPSPYDLLFDTLREGKAVRIDVGDRREIEKRAQARKIDVEFARTEEAWYVRLAGIEAAGIGVRLDASPAQADPVEQAVRAKLLEEISDHPQTFFELADKLIDAGLKVTRAPGGLVQRGLDSLTAQGLVVKTEPIGQYAMAKVRPMTRRAHA